MSYILDALKRADAERERGNVPGLRAQQVPLASAGPQASAVNLKLWLGIAAGLIVLLLAVLVWRMTASGVPTEKAPAPKVAQTAPAAPIAPSAPVVPGVPAAPKPPAPQIAQAPATRAPSPVPSPAPSPAPVVRAPAAAVSNAPSAPSSPAPSPAPVPVAAPTAAERAVPAAKATASAPTEAAIPSINELPDSIKRQLPALAISGSIYSDNPSQRMLTIGSQVFQEGDKPAPDLVLEQIRQKSAVFNFRGTRYSVTY